MNTSVKSDDPFAAEADPYPSSSAPWAIPDSHKGEGGARDCHCDHGGLSLSRRQAIAGAALLTLSPLVAQAETVVPCVQTTQKPQPCRHKFCRYYAGEGDYHGR